MTFIEWLYHKNKSGAPKVFCYLRTSVPSQLAIWRENRRMGKRLPPEALEGIESGQQAVDAYLAGRVHLFQRKIADDLFEYIAVRRRGEPPELFEQMRWKEWQRMQVAPIKRREKERERIKEEA